tara:strand:+ start:66 stop:251 length:186 start_codon:yes stop_codon:yes gene_type:complete
MNTCISLNSIALRKILIRYKLTSKGGHVIIDAAQKRYSTWSIWNRVVRKIVFKELNINKNK